MERKSCKRLTNPARLVLPCKIGEVLARTQNVLQDFDLKNLAYQDISKILQVLQDLAR